jgi:zinc transport system permease protein
MMQIAFSLITAFFIGGAAGYLGSLMLSKRMALVAGPLGHLTLPGISLALIYHFNPSLGAFPFVILGIFLIWFFELKTKLPMEALTAVVFASGVAAAFLFLPIEEAEAALIGDIAKVSFWEMIITALICVLLLIAIKRIYPQMVLINISEDLAKTHRINVKKMNFFYLLLIGIIVALGVKMVGGLLTAALVAIPPAASRNFSGNLMRYVFGAIAIGALASLSGVIIYYFTQLPAGPLIILVSTAVFIISIFFKRQA